MELLEEMTEEQEEAEEEKLVAKVLLSQENPQQLYSNLHDYSYDSNMHSKIEFLNDIKRILK